MYAVGQISIRFVDLILARHPFEISWKTTAINDSRVLHAALTRSDWEKKVYVVST